MKASVQTCVTVMILCSVLVLAAGMGTAEIRVDDLPKPIPQVMEQVEEVGNEVGQGISTAASTTVDAVGKAVKGDKSDNQTLRKSTE